MSLDATYTKELPLVENNPTLKQIDDVIMLPTQTKPTRGWWMAFPNIAGYSMNPVNLFNETH